MSKLDTSFLDDEYWKKQNIDKDQLVQMYQAEYNRIKESDPDLPDDDLEVFAQEDLRSTIAEYKKGGASIGKGVPWGITPLFDYIRMWKQQQVKAYENLVDGSVKFAMIKYKDEDGTKKSKKYTTAQQMIDDKLIRIDVDKKTGVKTIVALDRRGGKKRGQMYPESGNLAMFIATWESSITKKKYVIEATLGGESDDNVINPKCPNCGTESYESKCTAKINIVKDGHKTKVTCNDEREGYQLPAIMDACGTLSSFSLSMKVNDKKELTGIEWNKDLTKILPGKPLEIKMDYERKDGKIARDESGKFKKILIGDLLDWVPGGVRINSTMINEVWSKSKTMLSKEAVEFWKKWGDHAAFAFGTLYSIGSPYYGNRQAVILDDGTKSEVDDGLHLKIPTHVYKKQMENKIGKKSFCLFVGKMEREQARDFKSKKYLTAIVKFKKEGKVEEKEVEAYAKPYIAVSCVIPIRAQLAEEEKVKPKITLDLPETDTPIVVQEDTVSDEEAKKAVEKMKGTETVESEEEYEEDDSEDETEEELDDDDDESEDAEVSEDDSEPDSDDEVVDDEEEDEDTSEEPSLEDTEEAPEEVESLESVDKIEKKQKGGKRKW